MNTKNKRNIHKVAGTMALLVILTFFLFSLYAELVGDHELIKTVKTGIIEGITLLFLIMPATVITGRKLAGQINSPINNRKLKRMKFIAADALILITLAIVLYYRAINGKIDNTFLAIQIVEFTFGLLNVVFLSLMICDGKRLATEIRSNGNKIID
jgi:hypothetical protein